MKVSFVWMPMITYQLRRDGMKRRKSAWKLVRRGGWMRHRVGRSGGQISQSPSPLFSLVFCALYLPILPLINPADSVRNTFSRRKPKVARAPDKNAIKALVYLLDKMSILHSTPYISIIRKRPPIYFQKMAADTTICVNF